MATGGLRIRRATVGDRSRLQALQREAVRRLSARSYSPRQIDRFLRLVGTYDETLIAAGTYFVVEDGLRIVGCGGWSRGGRLFGGERSGGGDGGTIGSATIRAVYTRPDCARRGVGRAVMAHAEAAARVAGFRRLRLSASLFAVPFYKALGYRARPVRMVTLPDGTPMPLVPMEKTLETAEPAPAALAA